MAFLAHLLKRLKRYGKKAFTYVLKEEPASYWENRAKQFGALAVLDKRHKQHEIDGITDFQVKQIFPYLEPLLTENNNTLLDFGCGTGRFMPYFKKMVGGQIIGVDPIRSLINLAPAIDGVEYRVMDANSKIPVESEFADVLWICLVLGGIKDSGVEGVIRELLRVAKRNALVCLIENTSDKRNAPHWTFRSKAFYQHIFPGSKLQHVNDYNDFDEQISVFVGRINPITRD